MGTADSKGLSFNTKQKFWTLAFVLDLLKTQLDFSIVGWTEMGHKSSLLFLLKKHLATPQSPMHGSMICFSCDPMKEASFHWQQIGLLKEKHY